LKSDVPLDPAYRFGRLPNGMRYIIRPNTTPKGEVLVRMEVAAGSLDESDAERGYAHYVEHMAFQGSTHVPSGEMVRLLERLGLAFGADTNAQTSFDHTTYQLDLPRNDASLIDTALMLMRETASELTFPAAETKRERGVVLAEKRDRNSWSYRALENRLKFTVPGARFAQRLPIGTTEALDAATPDTLRAFWSRHYVPARPP
jgi:zinc protease